MARGHRDGGLLFATNSEALGAGDTGSAPCGAGRGCGRMCRLVGYQEHPPSRAQLGMTVGPQAAAGGRKKVLGKVLSWLPTQGSAMGTSCSLGKGLGSCTAPQWHPCCQDRAWSSEHPSIPELGGLWAPHPPHHLCGCPALATAGPKPWEWEKQELAAPELLERGVLPCPTHAGAIGHHWAPSSCPQCPGLPVAPTPGRPAPEPIWRL